MMKRTIAGFTLIELMITVAIVAILALIAIPSYEAYVIRTRRTEARKELLQIATAQERFFTNCNSFATALDGDQANCSGLGRGSATPATENGYYRISLAGAGTSYTLTATPQGVQTKDTGCTTLTLTDAGVKGAAGTAGAKKCWGG